MTQRRRLSRAQVAAGTEREVRPGISAAMWWPDRYRIIDDPLPRPPAQDAALFRREDIERAMSQRPMTADDLREWQALMMEPASPRSFIVSAPLAREIERFGGLGRSDDKADALALAWQSLAGQREGERAAAERRAVERTGRVLVAWLIGRWRR